MPTIPRLILPFCLVAVSCIPAYAQSETELRDFFEGKSARSAPVLVLPAFRMIDEELV